MSMNNWPEYGIGLVFTDEEIPPFVKAMGYEDEFDLIESKETDDHMWRYYNDDAMEGMSFSSFTEDYCTEPEAMLVIWAKESMDPFRAAYPGGIQELVIEYRNMLGSQLPADFDWKRHIGEFSCSVYC